MVVVVLSGIHGLLVRCFRRARAQQLARGAALVSGVLPSVRPNKGAAAICTSKAFCAVVRSVMRSNWPRRQRVLAASWWLAFEDTKNVEKSCLLACCKDTSKKTGAIVTTGVCRGGGSFEGQRALFDRAMTARYGRARRRRRCPSWASYHAAGDRRQFLSLVRLDDAPQRRKPQSWVLGSP